MFYQIGVLRYNIEDLYTYQSNEILNIGQLVIVNFNHKDSIGIIISQNSETEYTGQIKDIIKQLPYNISYEYIKFIQFVSNYNVMAIGSALKLMIPFELKQLQKVIKPAKAISANHIDVQLNEEQIKAIKDTLYQDTLYQDTLYQDTLRRDILCQDTHKYSAVLLHGITGSGKTEVFLEIAKQLNQVLILVPEISLSNALAKKIAERCNAPVFIWHNSISINTKLYIWKQALSGEPIIVVGARSALFIPFRKLELIVIDEEHDATFQQTDRQIYHARDMAVYLAYLLNITIILSSATPSIETYYNAISGKYKYVKLTKRYHSNAVLPKITIQNLKKSEIFADETIKKIKEYLNLKQQVLIFVNRRGYAPKRLCTKCGWKIQCPACDTWLCYHTSLNKLMCHHCGYETNMINKCKKCKNEFLTNVGVGIEKVYAECKTLFQDAKIEMFSSENMSSYNKIDKMLSNIENIDIIIGTQVLAKGHNFNKVNLVVIPYVDYMLYNEDYKAVEQMFQLLSQVSGRAGRTGNINSEVIVQTYDTNNLLLKLFQNNQLEKFYEQEIKNRKLLCMPPFSHLATIELSSKNESLAHQQAIELIHSIKTHSVKTQNTETQNVKTQNVKTHSKNNTKCTINTIDENNIENIKNTSIKNTSVETCIDNTCIDNTCIDNTVNNGDMNTDINVIGPIKPVIFKINYIYRFQILLLSKKTLQPILQCLKHNDFKYKGIKHRISLKITVN